MSSPRPHHKRQPLTETQLRRAAEDAADGVTWTDIAQRHGMHGTRLREQVEKWQQKEGGK